MSSDIYPKKKGPPFYSDPTPSPSYDLSSVVNRHSAILDEHNKELRSLADCMGKLNVSLPFFIKELGELVDEFKKFKENFMAQQLENLEKEHEAKLKAQTEKVESNLKLKILWGGIGTVLAGLTGLLIKFASWRLGL